MSFQKLSVVLTASLLLFACKRETPLSTDTASTSTSTQSSATATTTTAATSTSTSTAPDPALTAAQATATFPEGMKAGDPMPMTQFKAVDGTPYDLASLKGKVVLLNVWATWCVPCRAEIPDLIKLSHEQQGKPFQMVGVSVDPDGEQAAVQSFVKEMKIDYPILHDPSSEIMTKLNNISAVPITLLLDKDGKIQWMRVAPIKSDDPTLRDAITALIAR